MGGALPFVGLLSEGEFRGALRDYREGLGSRSSEFMDLRFDPFDDEVRGVLGGLGEAVGGVCLCSRGRGGGTPQGFCQGGGVCPLPAVP